MILERKFKSCSHPYCDVSVKFSLLLSINLFSYVLYVFLFFVFCFFKNLEWNLKKEIQGEKEVWKVIQVNMTVTGLLQI